MYTFKKYSPAGGVVGRDVVLVWTRSVRKDNEGSEIICRRSWNAEGVKKRV